MHWNGRALFDTEGELVEYQAVGRDKTEQKLAEDALQEREAKLQSIVNAAPVGIGLTVNRYLTEVNNSICEMIGYSANELLGRSARILYPSDEVYEYVGTVKYQMIREKGIGTVETQMQHKSGKILDVLMSSTPIDPEHFEKGVTFSVLDITERKLAEKALQEANIYLESKVRERTAQLSKTNDSLITEIEERKRTEKNLRLAQKNLRAMASEVIFAEERSRQHFATDLHDTVVQTLGAAKLRGQLIQDQIPRDAQPVFTEMQDMLSESIIQSRQIMSEMSPPVLYELGFIPALEWLADQVGSHNNINIRLKGNCAVALNHDVQVLLFQAVRELLLNVVKHAQAKEALVAVTGDQKCVRITVKDNGKGFDGKISFRTETNRGFGLFSIRERLKHLGGKLVINSNPGHGTRVVIVAPCI
jgi:PAS domain S-box-containing protein